MYAVRRDLCSFPCMVQRSKGVPLVCSIATHPKLRPAPDPVLELSRSHVSLRFFFSRPDRAEYSMQLLSFLSILQYLKRHYSVNFSDLYGYMIEALRNSWSVALTEGEVSGGAQDSRIDSLSGINVSLAHELIALSDSKADLEKDFAVYKRLCLEMLEGAGVLRSDGSASNYSHLLSLGVERGTIDAARSLLATKR